MTTPALVKWVACGGGAEDKCNRLLVAQEGVRYETLRFRNKQLLLREANNDATAIPHPSLSLSEWCTLYLRYMRKPKTNKITNKTMLKKLRHQSLKRIYDTKVFSGLQRIVAPEYSLRIATATLRQTDKERARERLRVVTVENALTQESWRQLHHSMA
jgi:hypothetical protein